MKATDLMHEFRIAQSGDWWGDTMHWWFTVAEEIYLNRPDLEVPPAWRYRQSPCGAQNDPDDYVTADVQSTDDESLMRFGRALNRYAGILDRAGASY